MSCSVKIRFVVLAEEILGLQTSEILRKPGVENFLHAVFQEIRGSGVNRVRRVRKRQREKQETSSAGRRWTTQRLDHAWSENVNWIPCVEHNSG